MANNKGFGGLDKEFSIFENSEIAVLSVPYDGTSTWLKGADKGPLSIIEASTAVELYDIDTNFEVYKRGIYTCPALKAESSPEKMSEKIEDKVDELIKSGKFVVLLGGEHSVSIGSIKAHRKSFNHFSVLQLDAHSDLRRNYEGSAYNHACVMARAKEISPVVQVGIRSMCIEEKKDMDTDNVFFAKDIVGRTEWTENVIDRLTQNVYVTIDLDVFDPAIMPSTGTPEPGGLFWYDVINLLKKVGEERDIVGFDVVELCPDKNNRAPDFTAAKLVYSLLSYVYKNRK